jgi:DNA-directed RNA polymerase specialized sigma24 family protein
MAHRRENPSRVALADLSAPFPETQTEVLAKAAAGDWEKFLHQYLNPCWREIRLSCQLRHIPLDDVDDLLQELAIRLMRDGQFRQELPPGGTEAPDVPKVGNVAGRFLAHREAGLPSARFRTYLKQVIQNLLHEYLRGKRRLPATADSDELSALQACVEESVLVSLDRQWVSGCLGRVARKFRDECASTRLKGQRRLFQIFFLASVRGWNTDRIAAEFRVDASTIRGALIQARQRFVQMLSEETGISSRDELKKHVAANPTELLKALAEANEGAPEEVQNWQ